MGKYSKSARRRAREQTKIPLTHQAAYVAVEPIQGAERVVDLPAEPLNAPAPPALRLVRSETEFIHGEPVSGGLPCETVDPIPDQGGSGSGDRKEAVPDHVVAPADPGTDVDLGLIRRSFDANEINAVLNEPSVFKFAAAKDVPPEKFDVSDLIADVRNVLLMADGGAILFIWREPSSYEVHTNFIKPDREKLSRKGPHIKNVCLAAYYWMFTHTDCLELLTKIPAHNRGAWVFSPLIGWTKEFERKNVWETRDGDLVDMAFCSLRYDDWVRKTPSLMKFGRKFHERIDLEFERHGHPGEQHQDEDCHDLHVGACAEMILGGQVQKAVALYNRWASFAAYGLMRLVSINPTVIDIGNAILQVTGDTFKVIRVK